jgi:formate dehydrogenase subunit gamma
MRNLPNLVARAVTLGAVLAGLGLHGLAAAQTVAPADPAPGFVAPAEPQPNETNAQRAVSQPGNNAPMWRAVRDSGDKPGVVNMEGVERGVLVQPFVQYPGSDYTTAGEAWRQVRNDWIIPYGGSLLLVMLVAMLLMYFTVGPIGGHVPDTGRKIERFTPFERSAHGLNAAAFVVLAVSGIVMAFGKFFLLPILGGTLFGWLTYALKTVHNFVGPLFAVTLIVVIVTFVRDNMPRKGDLAWLKSAGGLFGDHQVPSHRFNAGEKVVFWGGVFLLGLLATGSGIFLNQIVPGMSNTRGQMQIAHMIHGVATALMMAMFVLHIYLGTIGAKGALNGMVTGYCDEGWAQEHHELWFNDVKAGKIPAQRSGSAAAAVGQPRAT